MQSSPDPSQDRHAPIALWRSAGHFFRTLLGLFGVPEAIAAEHTLTAKSYKLAISWIRVAEAFVRQLLLIEAAAQARPRFEAKPRKARQHARRILIEHPDTPATWRVSFQALMRAPSARQQKRTARTSAPPKRFHDAWPLAHRVEALLRVYDNPAPYAARLARRLYARPAAAERLRSEPAHFEHRIDDDVRAGLRDHGALAMRVFCDTS